MSPVQQNLAPKPNNGRGTPYPEILPRGYIPTNPLMEKDTPKVAFNRRCLKEQHIPVRWICIKCDYNNYNDTPICGLCKRPKSDCVRIESNGKPQYDEWRCPQCSQFNYLFRDDYGPNDTKDTQPLKQKEEAPLAQPPPGDWVCQRCGSTNQRDSPVCQKCALPRYPANVPTQPPNNTQPPMPTDQRINDSVRSLYDSDSSFLKDPSFKEAQGHFVDRSRSRSPRVKPAEPPSYHAYAATEVAPPAVMKQTDYTQYAQSFSREQAIFAKSRGTCSRECPETCVNNRVYIHNFPTFINPHDIERWLEQVGKLEVLTRQCQRRRHVVIWNNGKGNCDAVAFVEPRVAHIAAVYLDKSRIGEVEMQVTMPDANIDQFIDSVGGKFTLVRSRFRGGVFV